MKSQSLNAMIGRFLIAGIMPLMSSFGVMLEKVTLCEDWLGTRFRLTILSALDSAGKI
jgi:hypothetical protein